MNARRDPDSLEALVIETNPQARITYDVARQLSALLPIESLDEFVRSGRVSVAGEELRVEELRAWLPEELFPISDQADLVTKLAAVIRVAGHVLRHEAPPRASEAHVRLARELAGEEPRVGVAVFRGPSLFEPDAVGRS